MSRSRTASPLTTTRHASGPLYRVIGTGLRRELKRLGKTRQQKRAAVAYVTSDVDVRFSDGDVLIVDASDTMIAGGQTDAGVLRDAFERGASLYSLTALHAKLFLFDEVAVIGSANLSQSTLFEAGIVTTDHVVVSGVASLIDEMSRRAEVIDRQFLDRIARIPVVRRFATVTKPGGSHRPVMADRGYRTWIVAVDELRDEAFPEEAARAERGAVRAEKRLRNRRSSVSWIRFAGNSRFRNEAKEGDTVVQIHTALGAKRPRVLRHSPILRVQKEVTCTRFYVESAPSEDRHQLTWTEFLRISALAGWLLVPKRAVRQIPDEIARRLNKLWLRAKVSTVRT